MSLILAKLCIFKQHLQLFLEESFFGQNTKESTYLFFLFLYRILLSNDLTRRLKRHMYNLLCRKMYIITKVLISGQLKINIEQLTFVL